MTQDDVFAVQETTSIEKLVLLYLHKRGCSETHVEVKFEDIMKNCNISRSSVKRALKGLEAKKIIDIFYQSGYIYAKHIKITLGKEEAC